MEETILLLKRMAPWFVAGVVLAPAWSAIASPDDPVLDFPVRLGLREPVQQDSGGPGQTGQGGPVPRRKAAPFFATNSIELDVRAGMAMYGGDYESDPKIAAGIGGRAAMPWLSRELLGMSRSAFGAFGGLGFSQYEWDTMPKPSDADGGMLYLEGGIDYDFIEARSWILRGQLGMDWIQFMGIDNLDSGAGLLVGVESGVALGSGFWVTANPRISLTSDGDSIFFLQGGINIHF